ncbi:hypothetical protein [Agreia sp. COWG]|uniref:hypothetical protein n=1 Tax=Agreia sp. COWG TaxID=2773266 RepID=UPI001925304C|nr:hypothetical protein [Agreia sp. COWG]CAD6004718.1 conserved membrane protein of unknown function [Agreia sp. COWG]
MSTNSDSERDLSTSTGPVPLRPDSGEPERRVIAEPSSVEPGTLEPVVVREPVEPEANPYVVRTTVPPMNPHTTGAPLSTHTEPAPPVAPPSGASYAAPTGSIPGGEIYAAAPTPVVVAPSIPPAKKGNRKFGTVVALIGTVVFAVVYAAVAFLFFAFNPSVNDAVLTLLRFLSNLAFIVPVAFFAIASVLLVLILNRAGWWAFILGGFVVGVVVYAGAFVGAYLSVSGWQMSQESLTTFLRSLLMDPLPLTAAVVAREVSVWTGAWIASRGRKVKARNAAAREEFDGARPDASGAAPAPVASSAAPANTPAW